MSKQPSKKKAGRKRMKPWTGFAIVANDGLVEINCYRHELHRDIPRRRDGREGYEDGWRIARVKVTELRAKPPSKRGRK